VSGHVHHSLKSKQGPSESLVLTPLEFHVRSYYDHPLGTPKPGLAGFAMVQLVEAGAGVTVELAAEE
jgi:hypothetical protein